MPFTKQRAFGAWLLIRTSTTGSPVYWDIAGIKDITGPGNSREAIDVTTHDSPSYYVEKVPGIKDGGTVSFEIEFLAGQTAASNSQIDYLQGTFESDEIKHWAVMLRQGTVNGFGAGAVDKDCWKFQGFVTKMETSLPVNGSVRQSIEIAISGPAFYTPPLT
jgi:predicted secreted protein